MALTNIAVTVIVIILCDFLYHVEEYCSGAANSGSLAAVPLRAQYGGDGSPRAGNARFVPDMQIDFKMYWQLSRKISSEI